MADIAPLEGSSIGGEHSTGQAAIDRPLTGFIPNLELRDPKKSVTSPQVISIPMFDSRLSTGGVLADLTAERIRTIRKDPTISFLRESITSPAIHTPWTYVETKKAPSGAKDKIEEIMEEHRLWLLQNAFYGCIDFGWQPFEKVLTVDNEGFNSISYFKQLLQDYTDILIYVDSGNFAGLSNTPTGVTGSGLDVILPLQNSLICNFEIEGTDWYGRSISEVTDPIQTKWDAVDEAASRFDRKVAGSHWVLYYPMGQTKFNGAMTDNDEIAKAVLNTMESSGMTAIPDEVQDYLDDEIDKEQKGKWRLELLSDSGKSQQHFTDREKYLDNLKARAFHLPERAVMEGKFGTKAEAETHSDIGISNIDLKHRVVVNYFNWLIVRDLMRMNYGPGTENTVKIKVAPLVDSQFELIKEIYRLIIQSPTAQLAELTNIDTQAMRQELDVPSVPDALPFKENLEEIEQKKQEQFEKNQERFKQNNLPDKNKEKEVEGKEGKE